MPITRKLKMKNLGRIVSPPLSYYNNQPYYSIVFIFTMIVRNNNEVRSHNSLQADISPANVRGTAMRCVIYA